VEQKELAEILGDPEKLRAWLENRTEGELELIEVAIRLEIERRFQE